MVARKGEPYDLHQTLFLQNKSLGTGLVIRYLWRPNTLSWYFFLQAQYSDHYSALGSNYDSLYSGYYKAIVDTLSQHIQFSATDSVVDIGGGTGEIGRLLREKFNFRDPVLCVEPSEAMLEAACKKEEVRTLKATAEEFFSKYSDGRQFSKILMLCCYHHFGDPGKVFERVAKVLTADGVCTVLCMTSKSAPGVLMFKKAKEAFSPVNFDRMAKLAESKGLRARVILDSQPCEIEKDFCFHLIRNRVLSSLSKFSEDEIEDGIREMTERYRECEVIKSEYNFHLAIITKV